MTYSEVISYFENLSEQCNLINDFVSFNETEQANRLSSIKGIKTPTLVLLQYSKNYEGNTQHTFSVAEIKFAVVTLPAGKSTIDENNAITEMGVIGEVILSRINHDSLHLKEEKNWEHVNLSKSSIEAETIQRYGTTRGYFGTAYTLQLKNRNPFDLNPSNWNDLTDD